MDQREHTQHGAALPKDVVSVRKIPRAEIDKILRDAIRRDSKYFRLPERSNGQNRRPAR